MAMILLLLPQRKKTPIKRPNGQRHSLVLDNHLGRAPAKQHRERPNRSSAPRVDVLVCPVMFRLRSNYKVKFGTSRIFARENVEITA